MTQVLLMSNDPIFKSKSVEVIARAGFKVIDVSDAFDGLLLVDRDGFSTIIIDEELADIDGYKAFEKTRQYSEVPLIMLGSDPPEDVWNRVNKRQFDVYLKKPVSPGDLVEQIKIAIRSPFLEDNAKPTRVPETTNEMPFEPETEKKAAVSRAVESSVPAKEVRPPVKPDEINRRAAVSSQSDSIEVMISGLECQILKIKTAITRIDQLRGKIDEAKAIVRQQQQGLNSMENKLQEINDQLKGILGDSDIK